MKRILSALLALCLLLSLVPAAGATGYEPDGGIYDHYSNYTLTLYVGEYWSNFYGSSSSKAYYLSGNLPDGLTWAYADSKEDSLRIYGTPTKAGQYTFTVNYEIESGNTLDQYHDTYITTVIERHVDDRSSEDIILFKDETVNRDLRIDLRGSTLYDTKLTQNKLPAGINWQRVASRVRLLGAPTATGYYGPSVFYSTRSNGTFNSHSVDLYVCETPEETARTLVIWENESGRHYLDMDYHGTEPVNAELVEGQLPPGMDWSWGAPGIHVDGTPRRADTYTVKFLVIRDDYTSEVQTLTIRVIPANCKDSAQCPGAPFTDMPKPSHWAHKGLDFCVASGLLSGTSTTTISPNISMNRAMLVCVLYRLAGSPGPGKAVFTDVKPTAWYHDAVSWAADNKIVNGTDPGRFSPTADVTREQIAAFLYRYAEYAGYDMTDAADLSGFPDASTVSSWARAAMQWAVANDLISGNAKNGGLYLEPKNKATRAQVATILMRFVLSA